MKLLLSLLSLIATQSVTAALPAPRIDTALGISAFELKTDDAQYKMIADAGFKIIRTDLPWEAIEQRKGQYSLIWPKELALSMVKNHIRPLFILDYSNHLYMPGLPGRPNRPISPADPIGVAAYARYASNIAAALAHYKPIYEIWNEPDGGFWQPRPDPDAYIRLATAACAAIRRVDPQATVIGPAAAKWPDGDGATSPWLARLAVSAAPSCFDAISIHPYVPIDQPGKVGPIFQATARMFSRSKNNGPIPIVNSEAGISTSSVGGVGEQFQAEHLVRTTLLQMAAGAPISIWFSWRDAGTDTRDPEMNFGVVHNDLSPKPAFLAARVMTRTLAGSIYRCTASKGGTATLLVFGNRDGGWLIGWSAARFFSDRLPASLKGTAFDLYGNRLGLASGRTIAWAPSYVRLSREEAASLCRGI